MTTVRIRLLGQDRPWVLAPGAIVGRSPAAALRVHDPEVSEAHAMVSLRGRGLHLLRLRGPLIVDGMDEDEVELLAGLEIGLSQGSALQVLDVRLPDNILAVEDEDGRVQELAAKAYSLHLDAGMDLVPGIQADALARLWSDGEGWWVQLPQKARKPVEAGDTWLVAGRRLRVIEIPVSQAAARSTLGGRTEPLTLVARHTSCHVRRERRRTIVIDGQPGRALSDLATMNTSVPWMTLALELWPGLHPTQERERLRRSWDRVLQRLRCKLREAGIRDDLVRPDGAGNVELVLLPGDRVVDES